MSSGRNWLLVPGGGRRLGITIKEPRSSEAVKVELILTRKLPFNEFLGRVRLIQTKLGLPRWEVQFNGSELSPCLLWLAETR